MEKSDIKLVEVRDRMTCIPMLAIRLTAQSENERWLLERAGYYGPTFDERMFVLLVQVLDGGGLSKVDPHDWQSRTYRVAHNHLVRNFDKVSHTSVIDVEYLLGESKEPKTSDRFDGMK